MAILSVASVTGTSMPLSGSPLPSDVLLCITGTSWGTPVPPTDITGWGAEWSLIEATPNDSVWKGINPTVGGSVNIVGGSTGAGAVWHLRNVDHTAISVSRDFGSSGLLTAASVLVAPGQDILAFSRNAAALPSSGALPSTAAWTTASGTGRRMAYASPESGAFTYMAEASISTTATLTQVVVGNPAEAWVKDEAFASGATSVDFGTGTAVSTDVVVCMTASNSNAIVPLPYGITGCGAEWDLRYADERCTVWVGRNPTSRGVVQTLTFGSNNPWMGAWFLGGVDPDHLSVSTAWAASANVLSASVKVGPSQLALMAAAPASTTAVDQWLPSLDAWTLFSSGNNRGAWTPFAPIVPDIRRSAIFRTGAIGVLVQAVIGTPVAPAAPTELSIAPAGARSLRLAWSQPAGDVDTSYRITVDGGAPIEAGRVTTYAVGGLSPDTEYDIAVTAYNAGGSSSPVTASATTLTDSTTPWFYADSLTAARRWWDGPGTVIVDPETGEHFWWDGAELVPADLLGWWDGADVQPAALLGYWDGATIQPLA